MSGHILPLFPGDTYMVARPLRLRMLARRKLPPSAVALRSRLVRLSPGYGLDWVIHQVQEEHAYRRRLGL